MTADAHLVAWTVLYAAVALADLALLAGIHHGYTAGRRASLRREWDDSHHRIRRRMRGLTRRDGTSMHTEPCGRGRGWVWIAVDTHHEAMGIAWTRRGARRRLAAFVDKGATPDYLICHPREDRP